MNAGQATTPDRTSAHTSGDDGTLLDPLDLTLPANGKVDGTKLLTVKITSDLKTRAVTITAGKGTFILDEAPDGTPSINWDGINWEAILGYFFALFLGGVFVWNLIYEKGFSGKFTRFLAAVTAFVFVLLVVLGIGLQLF